MDGRFTKILLALIATGVWANAVIGGFQLRQQSDDLMLRLISGYTYASAGDIASIRADLRDLLRGRCLNSKVC